MEIQPTTLDDIRQRLDNDAILVAQGPTGSMLEGPYYRFDHPHPALGGHNALLNDDGKDALRSIHNSYIGEGADIVEAYTWGPRQEVLYREGLRYRGAEITKAAHDIACDAARLAVSASGTSTYAIDTLRPIEDCYLPENELTDDELLTLHRLQANYFHLAGSGAVLLQTFPSIKREARRAVDALAEEGVPVLGVSAYIERAPDGTLRLPSGESLRDLAAFAERHGFVAGVNCVAPDVMVDAAAELRRYTGLPLYLGANGLNEPPDDSPSNKELRRRAADNEPNFLRATEEVIQIGGGLIVAGCCFNGPWTTAKQRALVDGQASPAVRALEATSLYVHP